MDWIIVALSIAGVILNIHKSKWGFVLYAITNVAWVIIDLRAELYSQAALFAVYFVLAIWGLVKWHRDQEKGRVYTAIGDGDVLDLDRYLEKPRPYAPERIRVKHYTGA